MKLTKEELIKKITERVEDDDLKMELLEDVADSIDDKSAEVIITEAEMQELSNKLEELSWKYENLKTKYIERFQSGSDDPEDKPLVEEKEEEDAKVIDIKEI